MQYQWAFPVLLFQLSIMTLQITIYIHKKQIQPIKSKNKYTCLYNVQICLPIHFAFFTIKYHRILLNSPTNTISKISITSIVYNLDRKVSSLTRAHQALKTKVDKKFESLDKNDQLGCLIVQGKGLPLYQKNERLCDVLIQLAQQKLNVKIQTDNIAWIHRISVKRTAPILAK